MSNLGALKKTLREKIDLEKAKFLPRFFKTGKGEYGEGDKFLGVTVPNTRQVAKTFAQLLPQEITKLLRSLYHEERLVALLILVHNFKKGTTEEKKQVYEFYLNHTKYISNWDLVDLSSHEIVGEYLYENRARKPRPYEVLIQLAHSSNLWEKRIAIVSTYAFIYAGEAQATLAVAEILLHDTHDLIHKAVGWMLREVGKRCGQEIEERFLKKHYQTMPRTMLRYAIEKFPAELREKYLKNCL